MLPGNDLAWKTIATLPFVATVAARLFLGTSMARPRWGPPSLPA